MTAGHRYLRCVFTLYHLLERPAFYFDSRWRAWWLSVQLDDVCLHNGRVRLQSSCNARNGLSQLEQERTLRGLLLHCPASGRRRSLRRRLIKSRLVVRPIATTTSSCRIGVVTRYDDFVQDLSFLVFSSGRLFLRVVVQSSRGHALSLGLGGDCLSSTFFNP